MNVHVKDRKLGGTTVPLGTGNAKIDLVIQKLQEFGYSGGLTMQAARGVNDVETAKEQLNYVRNLLKK